LIKFSGFIHIQVRSIAYHVVQRDSEQIVLCWLTVHARLRRTNRRKDWQMEKWL